MGDLSRKITVLGVEYGVRVCAQYTLACYYTEPYVVGVNKMRNLDAHFSCQDASLVLQCFYGLHHTY